MAKKIHDVCNTSKMAGVYNPAYIHVTAVAKTDLDNGRLAVLDIVAEEASYPTDATAKKLYLVKTPELLYDNIRESLTDFYNKEGKKVRLFQIIENDEFETTAFIGEEVAKGDAFQVNDKGQLVSYVDGAWKFEVVETGLIGGLYPSVTVKATLV